MENRSTPGRSRIRGFFFVAMALLLGAGACTEEIDLGNTVEFEDVLVVEGNITNEFKQHSIILSRSFRFEEDEPRPESNALVSILADGVTSIAFYENNPGQYLANEAFAAELGVEYQLQITTANGKKYLSDKETLSAISSIEKVYASSEINSVGTEVVAINVDSYDPESRSEYYRYEYEETYKIEAPYWVPIDFVLLAGPEPGFGLRPEEQRTCYNSKQSRAIIQTSTVNLKEDRVSKFQVRSIASNDPILRNRYSILVRQYVQSAEAYTYYNVLNQMSGNDNLFSTIQPGQLQGNLRSESQEDEKVLGYFEVSSVSEQRIFFDFRDVFPDNPSPPYFTGCPIGAPLLVDMGATPLRDAIESGRIKYLRPNSSQDEFEGPYEVVITECGDCRAYGSSTKPEFWED